MTYEFMSCSTGIVITEMINKMNIDREFEIVCFISRSLDF